MSNAKTICTVCNYIYDEAVGEPRQGIAALLPFDELLTDWNCPECGAAKEMFQPCTCVSFPVYEKTCVHHAESDRQPAPAMTPLSIQRAAVGELVARQPAFACVLEQYGIDYCCGGKITLEEACLIKGHKVEEVLEKLLMVDKKNSPSADRDWTTASLKELAEHIIETYHRPLKQELERISVLSEKVARVHGEKHPEMIEVKEIFNIFRTQLELHMQKEESVLFPGIIKMETSLTPIVFGCGGGVEHPIEVMTQEHDDAGEAMCKMRRLTNSYATPADACSSFKVLLASLAHLESEMHQHVHKENNILFPRAIALSEKAAQTTCSAR